MASREDDIQLLCEAVLEGFERDGGDHYDYCHFCFKEDRGKGIQHDLRCAVLVAKDLSAGMKSKEKKPR